MYSEINKDEQLLIGRLTDLANSCYNRNHPVFSSFLNLNEQNILSRITAKLPPVCLTTEGGYNLAERRLAVFLPDKDFAYTSPISIIKISQVDKRFSKELNHRDFLGALMNLGIERSLLGDIVIIDECAYLFCLDRIADFIEANLIKVRNDMVTCSRVDALPGDFSPAFKEITGTVASLRLDAVISLAFNESRSHSVSYIENGMVFVNGRIITTNAYSLKEGEIISVRGKGRFKYIHTKSETKKGRYFIVLNKYI